MMTLLRVLFVAVVPSFLLLLAVRRLDRRREPWGWVGGTYALGALACVLTMVLLVDSLIVGSGAPIGMQVMVAIAFVLTMFIVLEATLLSNVFAPGKTQAVLKPLHAWSAAHTKQIVYTLLTIFGVWNLVVGVGLV